MKKTGILGITIWLISCASNLWQWPLRSEAIWLSVPLLGTKCVSEEIHVNVVVFADYYVIADDRYPLDATVSLKVTSPQGSCVHRKENVTHGQFAFTTSESGSYQACFWVDSHYTTSPEVSVNLDWRTGVAAKDWESVARKDKIEGVELELRKIEGVVEAVHHNLLYLKNREAQMRSTSEVTNTRVALWSIMSLAVCVLASVMQLLYLKHYFRKKKLL